MRVEAQRGPVRRERRALGPREPQPDVGLGAQPVDALVLGAVGGARRPDARRLDERRDGSGDRVAIRSGEQRPHRAPCDQGGDHACDDDRERRDHRVVEHPLPCGRLEPGDELVPHGFRVPRPVTRR